MDPSRIEVLSTLHAANLQLSASFFVEVARTQALRASDAPSPRTSALFSVGMLRSSITSSFFEVLTGKSGPGAPPWIFGPVFPQKSRKKFAVPFHLCALERFWAGPKIFRRPRGAQKCTQNHGKSWFGEFFFRSPVSTTIGHRFRHIFGVFDH